MKRSRDLLLCLLNEKEENKKKNCATPVYAWTRGIDKTQMWGIKYHHGL